MALLTGSQRQILSLKACGLDSSEIASELKTGQERVDALLSQAVKSLGARSEDDAINLARRFGEIVVLNRREREALKLIREGKRFKEAAKDLGISESAFSNVVQAARAKLGVKTSKLAVVKAEGFGVI